MHDDRLLTDNDRKSQLSCAYVTAVAAKVGYTTSKEDIDRDSVDLTISAGGNMRPSIDIQLKSSSNLTWKGDKLSFVLKRKNYDDLIADRLIPVFLVVFELPPNEEEWLQCDENALCLRKCAWWVSLRGLPAIETNSKTIEVPRNQKFDPEALRALMDQTRGGSQ